MICRLREVKPGAALPSMRAIAMPWPTASARRWNVAFSLLFIAGMRIRGLWLPILCAALLIGCERGHQTSAISAALSGQFTTAPPASVDRALWADAQRFYEARGCRMIDATDGDNEERLPDVLYEWRQA